MAPKKKLTKKEKARLEAERAEALRQEMEKERLRKLEEERQRRQIELEQAKRRQTQEIKENKQRRAQLKNSMIFFDAIYQTISDIRATAKDQKDWEKFMRCNGLPNANSPSDLRKYLHQWRNQIKQRNEASRNWLLQTDERTLLTQDANAPDLTRIALKKQQGNLGDEYAQRIREVLGILTELEETVEDANKPIHIIEDLKQLKTDIRVFLSDYLDEFSYKIMSQIERDMEIDRPGVSKHVYLSDVFKSYVWTYSKDAQIVANPKSRIGEQTTHTEIVFPTLEVEITFPPTVELQSSTLRGLWLSYDHFSDYCGSYELKKRRSKNISILTQTKREWRKRKDILQSMFDDCSKESPISQENSTASQKPKERSFDVDKLYAEYEEELNKARKRAIGPEAYGLLETDVNLRKYRIIGGVYCIHHLETPQQDKRLNAHSFIRTICTPNKLIHKNFYQLYKPPPPAQPGVRRLPEEIEAEMRMIEAALDKLPSVTVQLPESVIWFEPPIPCRWETQLETLEADLTEGLKVPQTATPTEATPLSTTNPSPLKSSPRFPAKMRERSSQQADSTVELPVREVDDFDMLHAPHDVDIYSLLKDFVVPRLPQGFCVRLQKRDGIDTKQTPKKQPRFLYLARHKNVGIFQSQQQQQQQQMAGITISDTNIPASIDESYLELNEPKALFPVVKYEKMLLLREATTKTESIQQPSPHKEIQTNEDGKIAEPQEKTSKTSSIESNASKQSAATKQPEPKPATNKPYMFSQLLADLDHLTRLEAPLLNETVNQISANRSADSSIADTADNEDETHGTQQDAANELQTATDAAMAAFAYYPGMSFGRVLEAQNEQKTIETETEQHTDESSSDCAEDDDWYDEAEYYNLSAEQQKQEAGGGTVHDFLSKHNQKTVDSNNESENPNLANGFALRKGKWSTRDVHDTKFNEDKYSMQFRTGRLGIYGFAMNKYSNMPYQTWEIKPDFRSPNTVFFSFTASIVSLDMTITSAGYCLNNFQGGSTEAINALIGRTVSLDELKVVLISSAVDIFPDEDAFCYTEGSCEKNYVMEMHLYACMSTLALSHNFGWSRWNLLAGSRTAVLLIREIFEGKKVPYYATLLVTPLKAAIIDCTEVSASFNAAGVPGMAYYADLYQLSQVYAQPRSLEKQRNLDPVLRDNVARILMAIRPLSFC